MANANKNKGDRGEREAVSWLLAQPGPLQHVDVPNPGRMKAAGIPEDVGDLWVFTDATVQVKNYKPSSLGAAVREAALGALSQREKALKSLGVGMVKVPGARSGTVQWVASTLLDEWPLGEEVVAFSRISDAITWLRDDEGPKGYRVYPRADRICLLEHGSSEPLILAPMESWLLRLGQIRAARVDAA